MSKADEVELLRLKPKASKMFFPTLLIAGASFGLAFVAEILPESDYNLTIAVSAGVVFLFWALPLFSYLFSYLQLTNRRLIYRFGFLGLRKRALELSELSSLEIQKSSALGGKVISIFLVDGTEFRVGGYARTKLLAAEIEALAKAAG